MERARKNDPHTSEAIATARGQEARDGANGAHGRGARPPTGKSGKANLSAAELLAGCRKMLEESIGRPCQEIETAARERIEEYDDEMKLGREVRDAAGALNQAIRGAIKVARHCRRTPYNDFVRLVGTFLPSFMKERRELRRLSWRLPPGKREGNKPSTLFVEAVDRTNFLGLIDRQATDQEMACLLHILGLAEILPAQMKPTLRATLKQTVDALRKARHDHGRPAIIARVKRELADSLRWKRDSSQR
ncbi:MAG: hypothetical protein WCG85_21275 [Polyangia bacterium]